MSSDTSSSTPRRKVRRRPKRVAPLPDHTVSNISAYLERAADEVLKGAQGGGGGGGPGGSSSIGSSDISGLVSPAYPRRSPPNRVIPESATSPRMRRIEEFQKRINESGNWLQKWYAENSEKVELYNQLQFELLYVLSEYLPGIKVNEDLHPIAIVAMLKGLLTDLVTKFNKFNLDLHQISGHEVAGLIQDHHRKVLEVVEDYENQIKVCNEELTQCREQIAHLDGELTAASQKLEYLERGTALYGGYEESVDEEQFMADLRKRVALSESLNSSMKEELQRERLQNEELQRRLKHYATDKVEREEKCMQNIVEFSKRAEINSMLEQGIKEAIQTGERAPNPQDCQRIINEWKNEINQVINENAREIDELLKTIDSQNKDIAKLDASAKRQEAKIEKLQTEVKRLREMAVYAQEEIKLQSEIQDFDTHISNIAAKKQNLMQQDQSRFMASTPTNLVGSATGVPSASNKYSDWSFATQPAVDTSFSPIYAVPLSTSDTGTYLPYTSFNFSPTDVSPTSRRTMDRSLNVSYITPESAAFRKRIHPYWTDRKYRKY